jgi:low affinity Fe/Cu permease
MSDKKKHPVDGRSTALTRIIGRITGVLGSFPAILIAAALILTWIVGLFLVKGGFLNQDYQLVINTLTTIITFLMVFVIQNTQNRDGRAVQTKLDAQAEALALIAKQLGIDDDRLPRLSQLVGVEDAPDDVIREAQDRVRDNKR